MSRAKSAGHARLPGPRRDPFGFPGGFFVARVWMVANRGMVWTPMDRGFQRTKPQRAGGANPDVGEVLLRLMFALQPDPQRPGTPTDPDSRPPMH